MSNKLTIRMEKEMKGRFLPLYLLGISLGSTVFASNNPPDKDIVTTNTPRFELTFGALFLQPTGTDLDYAVWGFPLPAASPNWNVATVKPGYSTGFDLSGRYFFDSKETDADLSWKHLDTSNQNSVHAGKNQFTTPLFQSGPSIGQNANPVTTDAFATAKFNYDVVNLDAGMSVHYFRPGQLRFYAGLSGARLKESLSATFQDAAVTYMLNSTNSSTFTGMGPIFGLDGLYQLPYHLGITGTVAASALIGSVKTNTNYTASSPQLAAQGITTNHQSINPRETTQVVPGFDAKLGINYVYTFSKGSVIKLEVGYQSATYFNAIVNYNPATIFGEFNLGTVAVESLGKSVSNFSVNGPYVNMTIGIA